MSNQEENPNKKEIVKNDSRTGNTVNEGNKITNEIVNPYVKNNKNQQVRTATAFKNKSGSGNPFADGDGGDNPEQTPKNNSEGNQILDKNNLDPHVKFLLRHYLDLAHPVYEQEEQTVIVKRKDGQTDEVKRKKAVFKGYQFYTIDGKTFNEWLAENVGEGYQVDLMTKEITKKGNVTDTKTT